MDLVKANQSIPDRGLAVCFSAHVLGFEPRNAENMNF
jgi:hypothetical protein